METKKFRAVVEWKIDNFSYWRSNVHGNVIQNNYFSFAPFQMVELYQEDSMDVMISEIKSDFTGDLSYIGPDGSLVCTQQVKGKKGESVYQEGPELEQVLALMKGGEGDRLVLRFCFPNDHDVVQRMCSTISVSAVSLKIDPKIISRVKSEYISFISYSEKKDIEGLGLQTVPTGESVEFVFDLEKIVENDILVESRVSLLNSDGSLLSREEIKEHVVNEEEEAWTFSDSLNVRELVEKDVTILVNVKIVNGTFSSSYNHLLFDSKSVSIDPVSSSRSDDSTTVLKSDFKGLYQDRDFSDFRLVCDDVSFPVHRNILSARSPVFKTMLSCDMKEAASGCMDIVDLDARTLGLFLTYLYTGAVEDLQVESAFKLYYAADKYQVTSLKRECVDFLSAEISVSNVGDILILADKHEDGELFVAVHDFILNNFDAVSSSEEWKALIEREPLLAAETWGKIIPE